MEFMMFYVNCGTQLEYYIAFTSNINTINTNTRDITNRINNAQETTVQTDLIEKQHRNIVVSLPFAHAQSIATYKLPLVLFYDLREIQPKLFVYPIFTFLLLSFFIQLHFKQTKYIHTVNILHVKFLISKCTQYKRINKFHVLGIKLSQNNKKTTTNWRICIILIKRHTYYVQTSASIQHSHKHKCKCILSTREFLFELV